MIEAIALEYFYTLFDQFLNVKKRVFVGYLGAALLIAVVAQVIVSRTSIRCALGNIFAGRIWLSRSALADYKILFLNQAVLMVLAPRLLSKLALATILFEAMHVWFDGRITLWPHAPGWTIAVPYTVTVFLFDDVTKYLVHRALHRWPVLWQFHKVHHTAETLTPLTVYRTHPVEAVIFSLRSTIVQGTLIAAFLFFFGSRVELTTILGVNIFLFVFNAAGSNLRHSHIWISYGRVVERILISPAQHQIHHSIEPRHYDRNFGAVLAIWDLVGGTLCLARKGERVRFGILGSTASAHRLHNVYLTPFTDALIRIRQSSGRQPTMPTRRNAPITGAVRIPANRHEPISPQ